MMFFVLFDCLCMFVVLTSMFRTLLLGLQCRFEIGRRILRLLVCTLVIKLRVSSKARVLLISGLMIFQFSAACTSSTPHRYLR